MVCILAAALFAFASMSHASEKPNIVFILIDDLGYGDVQTLNPERGKIATPNLDTLAREGMTFTDAHTSSSICTPSRYSLMTGRYGWRTHLQKMVIWGYDPPLIPEERMTVASLLKKQGYRTAIIGKWHLGLKMPTKGNAPLSIEGFSNVDWSGKISGGPCDLGFDSFFGISGSLDMAPLIYIEDDRFVGECTRLRVMEQHVKKPVHPCPEDFETINVLDDLAEKAVDYIKQQDGSEPFFAYIPLTSPHRPIEPTPPWQGKSQVGEYGDFVMQTDDVVGRIVTAVDDQGLKENTLIIVTSDNGCSIVAMRLRLEKMDHYPGGPFRGAKGSIWDGGHRVPFFVRWPAVVKAGSTSDQLICLTDFFATCAELTGAKVPAGAGEDSVSFVPALKGEKIETERKGIIHHGSSGHFAYREGKWKLLLSRGAGGWAPPQEPRVSNRSPKGQLYDMETDPGETNNLYTKKPEIVSRMLAQLTEYIEAGRSVDGPDSANDIQEIILWK